MTEASLLTRVAMAVRRAMGDFSSHPDMDEKLQLLAEELEKEAKACPKRNDGLRVKEACDEIEAVIRLMTETVRRQRENLPPFEGNPVAALFHAEDALRLLRATRL
jgi:hypothetical protein